MMRRWCAVALASCCWWPLKASPAGPVDAHRHKPAVSASAAQEQFDLGRRYRNGIGVRRDSARAHSLIRSAAQRDHAAAMFILSNMLAEGEGTARDPDAARQWLEAAAGADYPEALLQLALHLKDGAAGFERDEARAAQLIREAAHAMRHRAHDGLR